MGGRRLRKKEHNRKKKSKTPRAKAVHGKNKSQNYSLGHPATGDMATWDKATGDKATGDKVTDIVAYDAKFAISQELLHCHTCVVCRKQDYFMKSCSRCQVARCCSGECLLKHCSKEEQRYICVNKRTFTAARSLIPPQIKESIFRSGYHEISPHIHSIPRREVYQLMGGPRSVILLQVMSGQVINNILQVFVQDIDGFLALLLFHPPPSPLFAIDSLLWCQSVMKSIPPQTFLLLFNCCWNNHANRDSAAVDIRDLNTLSRLENTQEIMKSVTKNEYDIIRRTLHKLDRSNRNHNLRNRRNHV